MPLSQSDCGYGGSRLYSYRQGCRCDACREANGAHYSAYKKQARREGAPWLENDRRASRDAKRRRRAAGERI